MKSGTTAVLWIRGAFSFEAMKFSTVYITDDVWNSATARRVRRLLSSARIQRLAAGAEIPAGNPLTGKGRLLVTSQPGRFLKLCPGYRSDYICCGYHVLNESTNCPLDCTYCYLQDYLNHSVTTIYANVEEMLKEVDQLVTGQPLRLWRIGTGELADSLALDQLTGLASVLVKHFSQLPNAILELKTKTVSVDQLLALEHREHTVLAWSLNPEEIVNSEEHGAAGVEKRLQALARAQDAGYPVALHFDPLLFFPRWREAYTRLLDALTEVLDPARVAWVSFGSLRYSAAGVGSDYPLRLARRPYHEEMIPGAGNKMRYLKPRRRELYAHVVGGMRRRFPGLFYYFCMETPDLWSAFLRSPPATNRHLDMEFAEHMVRTFDRWRDFPLVPDAYLRDSDLPLAPPPEEKDFPGVVVIRGRDGEN